MSDQNHYAKLGVAEDASFDEIQAAKERLSKEHNSDRKQLEAIEAAYDAILMERLRMRQEGKIKVPDRIRFPEKVAEPPPDLIPSAINQTPGWFQRMIDTPSRADILWSAGIFCALSLFSVFQPPIALALGVACTIYFVNRKEHKFARALLFTVIGLVAGIFIGVQIGSLLTTQLDAIQLSVDAFAALVTFIFLWVISSFLR
jgi:Protein CHAPERONE-LIKE PROTEIN OF POR1-like